MSNDEDWRRRRAEEIFGPGQAPWSTFAPRKARGDEGVFPAQRPAVPPVRPPAAAPPAKAPEPPVSPKVSEATSRVVSDPVFPPPQPPVAKASVPSEPIIRAAPSAEPGFRRTAESEPRVASPVPPPAKPAMQPLFEPPLALSEPLRAGPPWRVLALVAVVLFAGVLAWLLGSGVKQEATPVTLATAAPPERAKPVEATPTPVEPQPVTVAAAEPPIVLDTTAPAEPQVTTVAPVQDADPAPADQLDKPVAADRPERATREPAKQPKAHVRSAKPAELTARAEPVLVRTPPTPDRTESNRSNVAARQAAPVVHVMPVPRTAAPPTVVAARAPAVRPSFSCRRARGDIVRAICRDGELAGLDREVATRFASIDRSVDAATVDEIHHGQTTFLNDRQNCTDRDCLVELYRNRLRELDEVTH